MIKSVSLLLMGYGKSMVIISCLFQDKKMCRLFIRLPSEIPVSNKITSQVKGTLTKRYEVISTFIGS